MIRVELKKMKSGALAFVAKDERGVGLAGLCYRDIEDVKRSIRKKWGPDASIDFQAGDSRPADVRTMQKRAHEMAVSKGWYAKGKRPVMEIMALLHSEISEAVEEHRAGRKPSEIYREVGGKPAGIPIELADVVIRIMDFCGAEGIDLQAAIEKKMAFNATRPRRHGDKVA